MPRRGDNIRKRKDGRWEARYVKNAYGGSSTKYGSVYGKSYREVKEKRDLIIKQGQCKKSDAEYRFKDILEAWQDANRVRLKESSVSRYQNLIETHILPELGNIRMSQLSAAVISRFLAIKLDRGRLDGTGGLSAAYVRSIMLIISSAISYGADANLCNPPHFPIAKPSSPPKELVVLSPVQQSMFEEELLENMDDSKLLIFITLYTGLRIGEACALKWEDISTECNILYVRQTVSRVWFFEDGKKYSQWIVGSPKTNSSFRCIPICSRLRTVLENYPYRKKSGYILSNIIHGGFVSPRTFEYRYKKILGSCGLDPVNYHTLRHTFATRCIEHGVDIKSLSEILGHSNAAITLNTYVHSSIELKRIQLEKLVS